MLSLETARKLKGVKQVKEIDNSFEMLPIAKLKYDKRIQRTINMRKVREMADRGLSVAALGVIIVNLREDGEIYVIDGQHRLELLKRLGHDVAPCMVHYGLSLEQEAKAFVDLSQYNSKLSATQVFHRKLIYNDSDAVKIRNVLNSYGLEVSKGIKGGRGKNTISAISGIEFIFSNGGEYALKKVLNILLNAWGADCRNVFDNMVLRGTHVFLKRYEGQVANSDLIAKLSIVPLASLINKARYLITLNMSPPLAFARAMLEYYNKGKRTNKLPDLFDKGGALTEEA